MFVERFTADVDRRPKRWNNSAMALLQISDPAANARPAPAPHRGGHRPRHHALAGRRCATAWPRACPTARGVILPSVVPLRPTRGGRASERRRRPTPRSTRATPSSRSSGSWAAAGRHRRARQAALRLRRRAGHAGRSARWTDKKSPVEVSAEILATLRQRAEDSFDDELFGAVITVPAYFDDAQRQATKDARSWPA